MRAILLLFCLLQQWEVGELSSSEGDGEGDVEADADPETETETERTHVRLCNLTIVELNGLHLGLSNDIAGMPGLRNYPVKIKLRFGSDCEDYHRLRLANYKMYLFSCSHAKGESDNRYKPVLIWRLSLAQKSLPERISEPAAKARGRQAKGKAFYETAFTVASGEGLGGSDADMIVQAIGTKGRHTKQYQSITTGQWGFGFDFKRGKDQYDKTKCKNARDTGGFALVVLRASLDKEEGGASGKAAAEVDANKLGPREDRDQKVAQRMQREHAILPDTLEEADLETLRVFSHGTCRFHLPQNLPLLLQPPSTEATLMPETAAPTTPQRFPRPRMVTSLICTPHRSTRTSATRAPRSSERPRFPTFTAPPLIRRSVLASSGETAALTAPTSWRRTTPASAPRRRRPPSTTTTPLLRKCSPNPVSRPVSDSLSTPVSPSTARRLDTT